MHGEPIAEVSDLFNNKSIIWMRKEQLMTESVSPERQYGNKILISRGTIWELNTGW
jgi:hypothetical protein